MSDQARVIGIQRHDNVRFLILWQLQRRYASMFYPAAMKDISAAD
jgi:hypothetical protein